MRALYLIVQEACSVPSGLAVDRELCGAHSGPSSRRVMMKEIWQRRVGVVENEKECRMEGGDLRDI